MSENIRKWIVYKHTNILNNKVYIGITCRDPLIRWGKNGSGYTYKSEQCKFANAIKKYGWENFSHEIIESDILDLQTASEREKYWISYYDSFYHGYNMSPGGAGQSKVNWKQVYQINKETLEIIKIFDNISQAARAFGEKSSANLSACCLGKQHSFHGYYWCYAKEYISWKPPCYKKIKTAPVYQIDPNDFHIVYQWPSINEACRELKIKNRTHITDCCKFRRRLAYNYCWCYAYCYSESWSPREDRKKYSGKRKKVQCLETQEIYSSAREAALKYGVGKGTISNCCNGRAKTVKGLHWRYLENE